MVVMTMMAVNLHLKNNPKQAGLVCQMPGVNFLVGFCAWTGENCGMRSRFAMKLWMMVLACALAPAAIGAAGRRAAEPLDLNRASTAELMQLPGMTQAWAARIVRFRPYRTKLDLLDQGVVTSEVYQRIRDAVVVHRKTSGEAAAGKNP
jgi:hypothetical protein